MALSRLFNTLHSFPEELALTAHQGGKSAYSYVSLKRCAFHINMDKRCSVISTALQNYSTECSAGECLSLQLI